MIPLGRIQPFAMNTGKGLKIFPSPVAPLYHYKSLILLIMKTRNLLLAGLLIGGLAFTSCQKDNSLQPANTDAEMKTHSTGEIWSVDDDPLSNFPDPFVDKTTITYRLNKAGYIRLAISGENFNSVTVLENGYKEAGVYQFEFDGSRLHPGVYIAQLRHDGKTIIEQMRRVPGTGVGNPLSD
jgi:hypothetical protein